MRTNWNNYVLDHPGVYGALQTLPRKAAREAFDRLMAAKPARIELLRKLLKANGVELGKTDAAVQELNDWFRDNLEPDPQRAGSLLPEWYSVVNDVGLFLGDLMIERSPNLRWEFYTWGKKDVSYQRPVIMGFGTNNPKVSKDPIAAVAVYGHRILASRGSIEHYGSVNVRGVDIDVDDAVAAFRTREIERDAFVNWLRNAHELAQGPAKPH